MFRERNPHVSWKVCVFCINMRNITHHTSYRPTVISGNDIFSHRKIPSATSLGPLNSVSYCLIFGHHWCGTCFISSFWHLEFWDGCSIFGKFAYTYIGESLSVFGLFTAALQNILVSWSKKITKRKSGLGYRRRRFRVRKGQTFNLQRLLPHSWRLKYRHYNLDVHKCTLTAGGLTFKFWCSLYIKREYYMK